MGCLGLIVIVASVLICMVKWRIRKYTLPPPDVPVAASPAEVRVKAVERKGETLDLSNAEAAVKFLNVARRSKRK